MLSRLLGSLLAACLVVPHAVAADTPGPTQGLTPEERAYLRDHRDEYLRDKRSQETTRAPKDIMAAPGEFEPVDGIMVAWTQFTSTLTAMVKEIVTHAKAYVVVQGDSDEARAKRQLQQAGVDMAKVRFLRSSFDAVWIRDYGPNFVHTKDGDLQIVDLVYNRPRPRDDALPSKLGPQLQTAVHKAGLILPGGNIIFDGQGGVILTDMVFDGQHGSDPDLTMDQLKQYMKDYFGVTKVIVLEQMFEDGTGHVDMFCKLLNPTTVIVGEYAKPSDGAAGNFELLNRNAEKLKGETNGAGEPFRVFRIPMPRYDGNSYTHTNSVMANGKVIVPVYGKATDEAALEVYRSLLPGYEVVGVDSNAPIGSNGALHCISHEANGDPFVIDHAPLASVAPGAPVAIEAKLAAHYPVAEGSVAVYWRAGNQGEFQRLGLATEAAVTGVYTAEIPPQAAGTRIEYYLKAEDTRGMYETSPEDASESNVHALVVGAPPTAAVSFLR